MSSASAQTPIKIGRAATILPELIGKSVQIHTGQNWKMLHAMNIHVGLKAGEFAATKYPAVFKRSKRKIGKIKYGS